MISQHPSATNDQKSKTESINSLKELINDKTSRSSMVNGNDKHKQQINYDNNGYSNSSCNNTAPSTPSSESYEQHIINLCQEYIELD